MPATSKAQFRLMQATAHGANTGVPKKVAKEFVAATPSAKSLPEHAGPKRHPRTHAEFSNLGKK